MKANRLNPIRLNVQACYVTAGVVAIGAVALSASAFVGKMVGAVEDVAIGTDPHGPFDVKAAAEQVKQAAPEHMPALLLTGAAAAVCFYARWPLQAMAIREINGQAIDAGPWHAGIIWQTFVHPLWR